MQKEKQTYFNVGQGPRRTGELPDVKIKLFPWMTSPLAGEDERRTGEGDRKKKSLFNPLIGLSGLRPSNHFPRQGGSHPRSLRGFTLIELLVVVLIIGILAAIAVPQYRKAVVKAQLTQAIVNVRALYDALEIYRLENGEYPPNPDGTFVKINEFTEPLHIQLQETPQFVINYQSNQYISYRISKTLLAIAMNWQDKGPGNGELRCAAGISGSISVDDLNRHKQICLSLCTDKQWHTVTNESGYCRI